MATTEIPNMPEAAATDSPRVGAETSLSGLFATVLRSVRDVVTHTVEVAVLESRLAGTTLATIAGIVIAILVLLLSVWGLLVAAGVYGMMELGLGLGSAILIAVLVNLAIAVLLALWVPRLAKKLTFSATRRVLEKIGPGSDGSKT